MLRDVVQTLENVASIYVNQMVRGTKTNELKMGDSVMLLKKDKADAIFKQTFSFPPKPGSDSGLTVKLRKADEGEDQAKSYELVGISVSTAKHQEVHI